MTKKLLIIFLSIFVCLFSVTPVKAITDPLAVTNNKFGIHILSDSDLNDAANLVNSGGGDFGYITFVIREDERNPQRWQSFFDEARKLHLIPIVRIATKSYDHSWQKGLIDEIPGWIDFLNSLNWVVENRYVVIGNEPNHASEWGGSVNPEEYADYLEVFSKKLKEASPDFFVLPAGLDASAPDNGEHLSEVTFLKRMIIHNKNIFNFIDGWTSHSYPNPNFSGSEKATGKGTLHTYEWEQLILNSLGVNRDLPIFITETGWAHDKDGQNDGYLDDETISKQIVSSFENNWKNPRIVAVTPFVLNYTNPPFDIFSWKKPDGSFYDFFYKIRDLTKPKGEPKQKTSSEVISFLSPPLIKRNDKLYGLVYLKNTGQTIWQQDQVLKTSTQGKTVTVTLLSFLSSVEPGEKTLAYYEIN